MNGFRDRIKELRRVRAADLLSNPKSWRSHPTHQRNAMVGVLEQVGIAGVVMARELEGGGLQLIDGHFRRDLMPEQMIPTIIVDVDEDEANVLLATFDPLSALATANKDQLESLLNSIEIKDESLMKLLDELAVSSGILPAGSEVTDDEIPPVPEIPNSKLGDLWILGDHRLLCGDNSKPENVSRLLSGCVPFIMVTDPPYGVEYDPTWRHDVGINKSDRVGKVLNDDRADWTATWALFPGSVVYIWHAGLHSATVQDSIERSGFTVRSQIVWVKPRMVLSRGHYHWQHEPAFRAERSTSIDRECEEAWYAVRKGETADWRGGRKQTTVWDIDFSGNVATIHGTQKPVECMARPIRNHGSKEDAVYDPFLGSGTTLIAAEQLGRRCLGLELDPRYCDVIIQRWEKLTGKTAILAK